MPQVAETPQTTHRPMDSKIALTSFSRRFFRETNWKKYPGMPERASRVFQFVRTSCRGLATAVVFAAAVAAAITGTTTLLFTLGKCAVLAAIAAAITSTTAFLLALGVRATFLIDWIGVCVESGFSACECESCCKQCGGDPCCDSNW